MTCSKHMPKVRHIWYPYEFLFNSDPGQETKIAIINYCQKLYSASGWSSNGCVICSDTDLTYTVPGLFLPNIRCVSPIINKLRFLQSSQISSNDISTNSTQSTNLDSNPTNNITTNPVPTTAGTSVIPTTVSENKTVIFTVCAISSPNCSKDPSGTKTYLDYFNQFKDDLSTQEKFKKTLDIINAQISSISIYSDTIPPAISTDSLKISSLISELSGLIKFKVSYQSPIKCYYQISSSPSTNVPSFDAIMSCSGALCGIFKPNPYGVQVSTEDNKKTLLANTNYNLFVGCTNDIPYSIKKSNVISAYSFTSPSETINSDVKLICNSSQFDSDGKCIDSYFIKIEYIILLIIILYY